MNRVSAQISDLDRVPPHNLEAEESVLGSMLLSHPAVATVLELLEPEDFYKESHRGLYRAMRDLYARGEVTDPIVVAEALKGGGIFEKVGGLSYLNVLMNSVPTPANAGHYAEVVRKNSVLRKLIAAAAEVMAIGYSGTGNLDELRDRAESAIFSVTSASTRRDRLTMHELCTEVHDWINKMYREDRNVTGLATGLIDLDEVTAGLQPSDLIIIGGRTSMGKTSLALSISRNLAVEEGVGVGIFSLEMSALQLTQRLLCSEARINSREFRTGRLSDEDWKQFMHGADVISKVPIYIDDTGDLNIWELKARARRLKSRENVGLIVVDFIQLMRAGKRVESRQQEVTEIARGLKVMAGELGIPVLALSQLSGPMKGREEKRPDLEDLRESGAIEQSADLVMFVYRKAVYDPSADKGLAEVFIRKHRNGPTGSFKLTWIEEYARFENYSDEKTFELY